MQHLHIYGLLKQRKQVAQGRKNQEIEIRLGQHHQHLPQGDLEQDEEARTREKREKVPILR